MRCFTPFQAAKQEVFAALVAARELLASVNAHSTSPLPAFLLVNSQSNGAQEAMVEVQAALLAKIDEEVQGNLIVVRFQGGTSGRRLANGRRVCPCFIPLHRNAVVVPRCSALADPPMAIPENIAQYQIILWVCIALALILLGAVCALTNMKLEKDPMLYGDFKLVQQGVHRD